MRASEAKNRPQNQPGFACLGPSRRNGTPPQIKKYMGNISGPLMDRIDIHIEAPAVPFEEFSVAASFAGTDSRRCTRYATSYEVSPERTDRSAHWTAAASGPRV